MKAQNPLINGTRGTINDMTYRQVNGSTIGGKKPYLKDPQTEAQVAARASFQQGTQTWETISPEGRDSYAQQAAQMLGKSGKPMTGKNLYVSISTTRRLQGETALDICPDAPAGLPILPSLFLSGYHDATTFVLLAHSNGLNSPVICEAIQAVSAGVLVFKARDFRVVTVSTQLPTPTFNLAPAFSLKFGTPRAGSQIAVRLTPVTATGYRGTPVIYSVFVAATQEEMDAHVAAEHAKRAVRLTVVSSKAA